MTEITIPNIEFALSANKADPAWDYKLLSTMADAFTKSYMTEPIIDLIEIFEEPARQKGERRKQLNRIFEEVIKTGDFSELEDFVEEPMPTENDGSGETAQVIEQLLRFFASTKDWKRFGDVWTETAPLMYTIIDTDILVNLVKKLYHDGNIEDLSNLLYELGSDTYISDDTSLIDDAMEEDFEMGINKEIEEEIDRVSVDIYAGEI